MSYCSIKLPLDLDLLVMEYQKCNGIKTKPEAVIGYMSHLVDMLKN